MKRVFAISIAFALATLAGSARASEESEKLAAAESLFQEGLRFKADHNYAEACKRFTRSEELAPAVGTLLNLGECHEQLHELAQAWLAYRQAITVADANADKRAERARNEAARIEPHVPHLTIAAPAGVTVMRDGTRIDAAALGAPIAIDPGRHLVLVSAPERKPWQKAIVVAEGETTTLTVPELDVAPHEAPAHSPRRTIGIGMEIGGGVLLAAGLVSGAIALSQWGSVDDACPNARCPRPIAKDEQDHVDTARTWATLATVGIISGAAILSAGIAIHLTAPKEDVAIAPAIGHDAAGFSLVWRR